MAISPSWTAACWYDHLGSTPNILRGLIFCADCGKPLVRYKQVTNKGTNLYYIYICRTHHADIKACPKKYLHETKLKEVLWAALQHEIKLCGDTQKLMDEYSHSPAAVCGDGVLERQILHVRQGLARTKSLYDNLYPSYVDRLMDEREYMELKSQYRREMERAQAEIAKCEHQLAEQKRRTVNNPWLKIFGQFHMETGLTEELAHTLIERVEVYSDNRVEITLKYQDEYQALKRLLDGAEGAVGP